MANPTIAEVYISFEIILYKIVNQISTLKKLNFFY